MGSKDSYTFWTAVIALLAAGIGIYFARPFFLKIVVEEERKKAKSEETTAPPKESMPPAFKKNERPNEIVPEDKFHGAAVIYDEKGFSPKQVDISPNSSGAGCLIQISNKSKKPLAVRLSPHTVRNDYGFPYQAIAAGQDSIIDPRYRTEKIAFHNHDRPQEEFKVNMAPECLP